MLMIEEFTSVKEFLSITTDSLLPRDKPTPMYMQLEQYFNDLNAIAWEVGCVHKFIKSILVFLKYICLGA